MLRTRLGFDIAQHASQCVYKCLERLAVRKVAACVVIMVVRVIMHRMIIDFIPAVFQRDPIPIRVSWHSVAGRAAQNRLDRRIVPAHHLGGFASFLAVIFCFQVPNLPGTIHLVTNAPVFDVVRVAVAVRSPQVSILCAYRRIAIFDQIGGILNRRRSHVHCQHRLGINRFAELDELIRAKLVGLNRVPRKVTAARALVFRTNAVFPAVAAQEITAGVAHRTKIQFTQRRQHIGTETTLVGVWGTGFVNAFVDGAPHVLGKTAEHQWRNLADPAVRIDIDVRF